MGHSQNECCLRLGQKILQCRKKVYKIQEYGYTLINF